MQTVRDRSAARAGPTGVGIVRTLGRRAALTR